MAPIRVGIVGLSSSAVTAWASKAHLPYLLSERGRARYEIVALCNSSEEAARRAIAHYGLPAATTRAYGDPALLAADPAVDLIVVSTRVDNHLAHALPAALAGKDLYVEWPLAHGAAAGRELVEAAAKAGGRTMVGVQGRVAPPVLKVRELIRQGRIGKVLSSEVRAAGGLNSRDSIPKGLEYFADRTIGGNTYTIGFGHLFDQVEHVLGAIQDSHAQFQTQHPVLKVDNTNPQFQAPGEGPKAGEAAAAAAGATVTTDVPDLVIVTGRVPASDVVADGGATLLARFRVGPPFPGEPPLQWTVHGDKGEIRLTARAGTTLHAMSYTDDPDMGVVVELHDFDSGSVEAVPWAWKDWQAALPLLARSVGELYERFADGESEVPTFESAQRSLEKLDTWLSGFH